MIRIFPHIDTEIPSPYGGILKPNRVVWQGIHVCMEGTCSVTGNTVVADLPVGHAIRHPCQVNLRSGELFCKPEVRRWLGVPFLRSLQTPALDEVPFTVERRSASREVVILNCIDSLYGHALLKLLNAERHLAADRNVGLVVLVQNFLRWLVPDGVSEVWTVSLPLNRADRYHPALDRSIGEECRRFSAVYLSKAFSHPRVHDISLFSGIPRHDDSRKDFRITWIWREDRLWIPDTLALVAKKAGITARLAGIQKRKVIALFRRLRTAFPRAQFTVAGIGSPVRSGKWPAWIEDRVTQNPGPDDERALCRVYSESRVVIGVHGSNMLLPSAHAGMTVDLLPPDRGGNFAQDIIFQETNPRLAAYRYRIFPSATSVRNVAGSVRDQISFFPAFVELMRS